MKDARTQADTSKAHARFHHNGDAIDRTSLGAEA